MRSVAQIIIFVCSREAILQKKPIAWTYRTAVGVSCASLGAITQRWQMRVDSPSFLWLWQACYAKGPWKNLLPLPHCHSHMMGWIPLLLAAEHTKALYNESNNLLILRSTVSAWVLPSFPCLPPDALLIQEASSRSRAQIFTHTDHALCYRGLVSPLPYIVRPYLPVCSC